MKICAKGRIKFLRLLTDAENQATALGLDYYAEDLSIMSAKFIRQWDDEEKDNPE